MANTNVKNSNIVGRNILPDFRPYYEATVIKSVGLVNSNKQISGKE